MSMPHAVTERLSRGHRMTMRAVVGALSAFALAGCTDGLRGVAMKAPDATGKIVASVTTSDPRGLVVFWDGRNRAEESVRVESRAWIAGSEEELVAVWKESAVGPPPRVEFASYVVFASTWERPFDVPKIIGLDAEESGLLLLRFAPETSMAAYEDAVMNGSRILAVPRRVFPTTVVFLDGYAFAVPEIPFG